MKHQYEKLYHLLQKKILKGTIGPGDILPSENELCATHQLARSTVRQALEQLVKDGLVIKHKGKGSIVQELKRRSLGLFSIKGFSAVLSEASLETTTIFIEKPQPIKWGENFFYQLSAEEKKSGAICIKRIRKAGNVPVMLEYTYVPDIGLPILEEKYFVRDSLFETLREKSQIEIVKAEQELLAEGASKEIAKVFGITIGTPVLHVYRRYHTNKDGFFVYSSFFCDTAKYSIGNILV